MSTIGIYLLFAVPMLSIVGIGFTIFCITEHRNEKKYDEFYSIYAVRKHAVVVDYKNIRFRGRNEYIYYITLRFTDDDGTYCTILKTDHHSAKKYKKVKEDDFLCLYDAIKEYPYSYDYIYSKSNEKWGSPLGGIPLVVLPAEESFTRTGRMNRLRAIIYIVGFIAGIGILLIIGENLTYETLNSISDIASKAIPYIAFSLPIFTLIFSRYIKH